VATQDVAVRYPHVFAPLRLGPVEVRNRIYMSPHGIPLEAPVEGREFHHQPAVEHAHYFAERAAGGVGLIFHSMQVGPFAAQPGLAASPHLEETIPSYSRVAEMVHDQGARIMAEIWYIPWQPHYWEALGPMAPQLAPSAVQNFALPYTRHPMRKPEIDAIVAAHGRATANLRAAGYDGVELHLSHGAILEYFLSPYHNHRTDEYGGSLENRARISREALAATRAAAGPDMAVGIRFTADQLLTGGMDEAAAVEAIEHLVATGLVDFVDVDISVEPEQVPLMTTSFFMPKMHNAERVANLVEAARGVPVIGTPGRVTRISEAEGLLQRGAMDMVGITRGLIAEPDLVRKAERGEESTGRICIAANHCTGNGLTTGAARFFGCAINPAAGREDRWGRHAQVAAPRSMRVVVAGGGPGGLEAARMAAVRGHSVTVFEARDRLGGGLALWADIPGRHHLRTLPKWFADRLAALEVEVRLGVAADAAAVLACEPDVVFVATGSRYDGTGESGFAPRPVEGWDRDFVHGPEAVISGDVRLFGRVLVLDEEGMHAAVGVAEIAAAGAEVELVTRKPAIADALMGEAGYVRTRLREAGVTASPATWVESIGDGVVRLVDLPTGERREREVDAVVLATMRKPVDALADELDGRVDHLYLIGDALAPRTLREATYEGHRFARVIGEDGMPRTVTEELFKPLDALRPAASA
jgi:2,4-dienoyl-CoA reductase-like NADH-dependent reductase (Old Yellow Enzyme family)/NADPH-dependent 2,4-dienoyl-CoA reductase/sulfur reductase-like enzyme